MESDLNLNGITAAAVLRLGRERPRAQAERQVHHTGERR